MTCLNCCSLGSRSKGSSRCKQGSKYSSLHGRNLLNVVSSNELILIFESKRLRIFVADLFGEKLKLFKSTKSTQEVSTGIKHLTGLWERARDIRHTPSARGLFLVRLASTRRRAQRLLLGFSISLTPKSTKRDAFRHCRVSNEIQD